MLAPASTGGPKDRRVSSSLRLVSQRPFFVDRKWLKTGRAWGSWKIAASERWSVDRLVDWSIGRLRPKKTDDDELRPNGKEITLAGM